MADTARVGAALKRWREARGLKQADVADLADVSQGTISSSESGSYSAGLLLKLISIYKPSADELATEMGASSGEASAAAAP
jgi:transcriptional regulator with XRE-family HTH domain